MSELRAADLDWFELRRRGEGGTPAILPVGSFEQHGPHLPLSTDAVIAEALADELAERIGGIALPVIPYGAPSQPKSGGGDAFRVPDVGLKTLLDAVESIARGTFEAGVRTLVVVSWHYENASVLWDALREAVRATPEARAILFRAPWDLLGDAELSALTGAGPEIDWPADHAGLLETAIMRAIRPVAVGEPPAPVPFRPRAGEVLPTPADAVPETGVVNDARLVDAGSGHRCIDAMAEAMAEAVRAES